ncbi:exported hypothetical protein [Candidatus Sulfopaludibacter sp. SbA3]|nr:exported hypothetical protein [Candidatus Sulfopaludibacter sp. SbA3]
MIKRIITFLLLASAVFGQINSGSTSVTVTATLGQNVSPDQIGILVTVESAVTATLADVMAALQGTDLTPSNLSSVYSNQQYNSGTNKPTLVLDWTFQLLVPLANFKSEAAALQALQISLSQTPLTLTYSVQGPLVSTQAQVKSCALADLVSAARTQAQQMASAANLKAGSILSLATSVSTMIGPSAAAPYIIPACSLTVTFALGQQAASALTMSASRTVNVPPDQIVVTAYVDTIIGATVDDALAALSGTGITSANLIGFSGGTQNNYFIGGNSTGPGLEWSFSIHVPFSKMKDTIAALQTAAAVTGTSPVTAVSFSVQGTLVSPQLLAAQDCSYASLVADAQAQARKVAAAASVPLGGIVTISDTASPSFLAGDFSQIITGAIYDPTTGNPFSGSFSYGAPPTSCGLTVQFGISQ